MAYLKPQLLNYSQHDRVLQQYDPHENTIVVSPTGSGKSVIMIRIIDQWLQTGHHKFLVVAPTNLLVDQLYNSFKTFLQYPVYRVRSTNLALLKEKRGIFITTGHYGAIIFKKAHVQVDTFDLICFDEVHRASSKQSPYHTIANHATSTVLGFSATLDSSVRKKTMRNLKIVKLITGQSPFLWKKQISFQQVLFPAPVLKQKSQMDNWLIRNYSVFYNSLNLNNVLCSKTLDNILPLMAISKKMNSQRRPGVASLKTYRFFKMFMEFYCRILYFYEGYDVYKAYLNKKSYKLHLNPLYTGFYPYENPKFTCIKKHICEKDKSSTVIVFLENFETLLCLKNYLTLCGMGDRIAVVSGKMRTTEKIRKQVLKNIALKQYDILLCTSVAEEGIDIGNADLVIFYKPINSSLRSRQREGRTGRHKDGQVIILYYPDTIEQHILLKNEVDFKKNKQE